MTLLHTTPVFDRFSTLELRSDICLWFSCNSLSSIQAWAETNSAMPGLVTLRRSSSIPHNPRVSNEISLTRSIRADLSLDLTEEDFLQDEVQVPLSLEQKREMWIRNGVISCTYVLLWYGFSVTLSLYNKWMFSDTGLDFNFPVLTTSGHQFVQFTLATITLILTGKFNKTTDYQTLGDEESSERLHPKDFDGPEEGGEAIRMTEPEEDADRYQPVQTRWDWFKIYSKSIIPCALASAADIGMGNVSLRFVTLTFYTMVKSSGLAWVLFFGIIFKLEVPSRQLIGIIGVMSIGVIMMVAGEAHFVVSGFLLVLGAAMFSGLRWSLTQMLLRGTSSRAINTHHDPLRTIMYLSPVMGLSLLIMGGILEGYSNAAHSPLWKQEGIFMGLIILITPGLLAFCMTLSEFMLLGRTSVLTLSIAGIVKELVTIISASFWFNDRITLVNGIGLVITLSAIIAYNVYRFRSL